MEGENMQDTPKGNRLHIAIFGCRNAGKSSLINALTNQSVALVSDVAGTTTDPVQKAMEILPVGPVMLIDTAGIDDEGALGELRVERSLAVLRQADVAILVFDAARGVCEHEWELAKQFAARKINAFAVANKIDAHRPTEQELADWQSGLDGMTIVSASAASRENIGAVKMAIIRHAPPGWDERPLVGDLVQGGDTVVLVVPIDLAAPKGRLILPQVQVLRDILDQDAIAVVAKERELAKAIADLSVKPKLVITDSQAFLKADADTPPDVLLTSFSILFARQKGELELFVKGAAAIDRLQPGDKVLIAEACTHHRVEDDIGTVKIPRWMRNYVGGDLQFEWCAGNSFPSDLSSYKLVLHCGACMINRREMLARMWEISEGGVPIVNYGIAIAHLHGILRRALSPFPELAKLIDNR